MSAAGLQQRRAGLSQDAKQQGQQQEGGGGAGAEPEEPAAAPSGLSPRVHNAVSYAGAALAFSAAVAALRDSGRCAGVFPIDHQRASAPLLQPCELAVVCWMLHFVRRTAESVWLHRYSQPTVPIFDTVTEYLYYWGFAAWIAHAVVCTDTAAATATSGGASWSAAQLAGGGLWLLAECGNCYVHVQLARLRPAATPAAAAAVPATSSRLKLPEGACFALVSFPHYLCEISSWLGWNLMVGLPQDALDADTWRSDPISAISCWSGVLFACVGGAIMAGWADEKHCKMRDHFDGKQGRPVFPAQRKRIIPFIF
jgi:hypothetical protein